MVAPRTDRLFQVVESVPDIFISVICALKSGNAAKALLREIPYFFLTVFNDPHSHILKNAIVRKEGHCLFLRREMTMSVCTF